MTTAVEPAFEIEIIQRLFLPAPPAASEEEQDFDCVYVAVDFNGGSLVTDSAIVSFVKADNSFVLVGLVSKPSTTPAELRQTIYAHISALLAQERFANARIVFLLEANLGNEARFFANLALAKYPGRAAVYLIFTKPGDPDKYLQHVRELLRRQLVTIDQHVVAVNDTDIGAAKAELCSQLLQLKKIELLQPQQHAAAAPICLVTTAPYNKGELAYATLFGLFHIDKLAELVRFTPEIHQANNHSAGEDLLAATPHSVVAEIPI